MKKNLILFISSCIISITIKAQSDISSPYSLYGLGKESPNYFSGLTALGNTGIAYRNPLSINKANPASLTSILKSTFLYEVGFNSTSSIKKTGTINQQNFDFSFTHLAMAFSINDYWSTSFGIMPYSKVNYEIDVLQPIEGTTSFYNTNIIGTGGISEVFWGNGLKLSNSLSVGVELFGRFGSVIREDFISLETSSAYIKTSTNYFSAGLNAGLQYNLKDLIGFDTTLGATISTPSTFSGEEEVIYGGIAETPILDEYFSNSENIDSPLKFGVGISSKISKNLILNIDYRKSYWSSTNQTTSAANYIDQSVYAIGAEFKIPSEFNNYWDNVKYRVGLNYDTGYLNLSKNNIDNYSFSLGLGMPISKNGLSTININYSYGKEGTINNNLIQDNFHKLSLNLSLVGNWFQKQKIF
jgi:hypothetical protein